MILYATKQTIKDLNIPMVDELSQFNRMLAQKVIEEQTNDRLLEWGLKIFHFDNRNIMQENKIALFEEKEIRRAWYDEDWYFSVEDVVQILTDSVM